MFTFFYKAGIALQDDALLPTAQHGACIAAVPPLRDCSTTPLDKPRQLLSRFPVTTMLSIHCSTVSPPHLAVAVLPHHTDSRTRSSKGAAAAAAAAAAMAAAAQRAIFTLSPTPLLSLDLRFSLSSLQLLLVDARLVPSKNTAAQRELRRHKEREYCSYRALDGSVLG